MGPTYSNITYYLGWIVWTMECRMWIRKYYFHILFAYYLVNMQFRMRLIIGFRHAAFWEEISAFWTNKGVKVIPYAMVGHSISLKIFRDSPPIVLWILRTREPNRILNTSGSAWHSQIALWHHRPFPHRCLLYTLMLWLAIIGSIQSCSFKPCF